MGTPSSGTICWSQIQSVTGGSYCMSNFNAISGRGYCASNYYSYNVCSIYQPYDYGYVEFVDCNGTTVSFYISDLMIVFCAWQVNYGPVNNIGPC